MTNKEKVERNSEFVISEYKKTKSTKYIAKILNVNYNTVARFLKSKNLLLDRSELAKLRTGDKNPFYGKTHSREAKEIISGYAKKRTKERNPNYRHGNYKRRTKDFMIVETQELRKLVFERDNYTCRISGKRGGGVLNAHHLIPYWVEPKAYLDIDNLITVTEDIHKYVCHNGDYARFNVDIIPDSLIEKYKLCRERLNELADFKNKKKSDVIVRSTDIQKTVEVDRNDLPAEIDDFGDNS